MKQHGFTIVELLIVIVVIAILATLSIVSYTGITNRATVASIQSDLANGYKQLESAKVSSSSESYPDAINCPTPGSGEICLQPSGSNIYSYSVNNAATPATFTLSVSNGSQCYEITNASQNASTCTWIPGPVGTALENKYVYNQDLVGTYAWGPAATACSAPYCATAYEPIYNQNRNYLVADNSVDFSAFPARDACKAISARLPDISELYALSNNRSGYGTFGGNYYWSSSQYNTNWTSFVNFSNNTYNMTSKTSTFNVRCVRD